MTEATPTTQSLRPITEIDVPGIPWIYYDPEADGFYQHGTRRSLGFVFWYQNIHRVKPGVWGRSSA